MSRHLCMLSIASLHFAAVFPAFAQTSPSASTLDIIQVTGARRQEAASEVSPALTIKPRAALEREIAQTTADLLHGEVGTFVQQTTPGQSVVIIRGLKGSEVLQLVDGFRMNNAFFRNAPNQYPALIDPMSIEQLEVVRGPASVLYGSDAMGGVVHARTASPSFKGEDWQFSGAFRSRFRSADESTHNRFEVRTGREGLAMQMGASYQDVQSLRVGGGTRLPFTDFSARYGDFALQWEPTENQSLQVKLQYARQPKTQRFDELVAGFGQSQPTSSDFQFRPQERRFGLVRYELNSDLAAFDRMEVTLGRQDIVDDRLNRDFGSVNRDVEQNLSELAGVTTLFEKHFDGAMVSYGGEYYDDEVSSARQRVNVVTNVESVRTPRFPDGSTMRTEGVFVALDYYAIENWDLTAGLRYSGTKLNLPAVPGVGIGVQLAPNKVTGNFGARFAISEELSWVANLGRGFRSPNVFDLGAFGARPGNRFNLPNPNLEPETLDSIDTGIKWLGPHWEGELIVFKGRYRDKITSLETGAINANGQILTQSTNATRLDLHGLEFGSRYRVNDTLSAFGSATLTRGTELLDAESYDADRIPPLFGKAGVSYQYQPHLLFDASVQYAARQDRLSPRDLTDPRINPNGTAGWSSINLRADWRVSNALKLGMSLENLADKRYREHGTGLDEPGRSVGLSLDYVF